MMDLRWRRTVCGLLAAVLVLGQVSVTGAAEASAGLCVHHEVHDGCGYREAAEGSPCAHVHDELCGYNEEEGTPCAHSHDETCGYSEPVEAAPCGYVCQLCAAEPTEPSEPEETTEPSEPTEPEPSTEPQPSEEPEALTVDSWSWVGGEELTEGELALPGASAGNAAHFEDIVSLLPYAVSTAHGELAVSWSCPGYPAEGAWEGSFVFTAALPEGYALAEGAPALGVTVILGGAQLYDTVTGTHGDNLSWSFDTVTGVLTVTGSGEMKDAGSKMYYPWYEYREEITSIVIGEGITTVSRSAFSSAGEAQVTSLTLPSTLKSIGYDAFYRCEALKSVTLPAGLESIGGYAFGQCESLRTLTIPDSVTKIDSKAFVGCDMLASVSVGKGLKDLEDYVFDNIDGLKTITVSSSNPYFTAQDNVLYNKSVTELIAYPMCREGSSFTVPSTVTKLHTSAFYKAFDLSSVTFTGAAPTFAADSFSNVTAEIRFDSTKSGWSTAAYRNYGGELTWIDVNAPDVIGGAVNDSIRWTLDLSTGAFTATGSGDMESYDHLEGEYSPWYGYRTQITSVTVGSGITSVGGSNFSCCTGLTSVSLASSVTEIGRSGFSSCLALASVSLPAGLTDIGIAAFSGCSKITSVTIPGKVRTIGDNAFSSTGLVSVTIPDSVYEVGDKAFAFCKGLKEVTFGTGTRVLGGSIFQQCNALSTLTFTGAMPSASDNDICVQTGGVTAIYPAADTSWTESGMADISTTVTWKPDCEHAQAPTCTDNGDGLTHKKTCPECGGVLAEKEDHDFSAGLCACGIGKCGDQVYWRMDGGKLTIYGTGPMYDYYNRYDAFDDEPEDAWTNSPPWLGLTIDSVTVEDGVTNIGNYAFFRMSVGSVTMAGSVTKVGDYAFSGTGASVTASPNITSVGECGLAGTHVDRIAKAVTVGKGAFRGTGFTDGRVAVSGWVQEWAFYDSGVTTLILGENVKYIRSYALGGCEKLTEIYYCGDRPDRNNDSFFPFVTGVTITHYRTPDATGFSSSAQIWEDEVHATVKGTPVAPTCTEDGYTPYTCPYCSIVVKKDTVPGGHSYTYTADDTADTITVGCGSCDLEAVFTLQPPASLACTGKPVEATVTGELEGLEAPTLTYTGSTTDGKPVDSGTYTATMTLGGKSVSVTFTLIRVEATVTAAGVTTEYTSLSEAVAAANGLPGSTVKLMADQKPTQTLVITGTDVTLDLNGFALKNSKDDAIEVSSGAKLTVTDSRTGGSIYGYVSIGYFTAAAIRNKGTLILTGGSLSAGGSNTPCAVINEGSFTMTGGTLNGSTSFYAGSGTALFDGGTVAAKMAVTGGTMELRSGDFSGIGNGGYIRGATVKITGGSFSSLPLTSPGATVEIFGGTFSGQYTVGSSDTTVYGGTFERGIRHSSASIFGLLGDGYAFLDEQGQILTPTYLTGTTDYLTAAKVRPEASIDFEAETLTGLEPGKTYTVGDKEVTAGSDGTLPIDPDWLGTTVTVAPAGQSGYGQELQIPGRPDAPAGVAAEDETAYGKADGKLTGVTSAMEYRAEGGEWTAVTGSEVTGLAPGTYEVRVGATDTAFASTAATFTVTAAPLTAADIGFLPPESLTYDGAPKLPQFTFPQGLEEDRVTVTVRDAEGKAVEQPTDVGTYRVYIDVAAAVGEPGLEGLTQEAWTYAIQPAEAVLIVEPISRQLFTGSECRPDMFFLWEIPVSGVTLREGTDYSLTFNDHDRPGTATVTVTPVEGSNFTFLSVTAFFEICRGVPMEGYDSACLNGSLRRVEGGILWLEEGETGFVTVYSYNDPTAEDPHLIYPTGMTVWRLSLDENGLHRLDRVSALDDILRYSGTSIRITGNQGIRFITSIPTSQRSALMGSGLEGFRVVEYGTLMGWYEPGRELLYGDSAKSVAYDKAAGTNAVFQSTGEAVQFTGMLTDLELEQSDRDLMTRPYMVLEADDGAGGTVQLVLYGGSITRSIGYVAYQNKDVFQPGSASYEFIWSILEYAYPDLYEQEYQG